MKFIHIIIYFTILTNQLIADNWQIKNINFHTENDADIRTDEAYSYGSDIGILYYIDDLNTSKKDNYISFSYVQQIYTPNDINNTQLIKNDRPYAGYTYFQVGFHQSHNNNLKSFLFQLGIVGKSSKMKGVQKFVHGLIGSPTPNGWEHQLLDEITVQFNYSHQKYEKIETVFDYDAVLITNNGFDFGNVSTKVYSSYLYRYGFNLPKNYSILPIYNSNYSKIPLNSTQTYSKKWGFCLNLGTRVNIVIKNIFTDGNSFKDSHDVHKNMLVLDVIYGFSLTYDKYSLDYIRTHTTKEYKTQDDIYSYGSLLFSYNF